MVQGWAVHFLHVRDSHWFPRRQELSTVRSGPLVTSGRTITFLWKLGQIALLCVSCYKAGSAQIKSLEGCSPLGSGLMRILCLTERMVPEPASRREI